ncbi:TetR/AcrR family transcriptional regulator [Microbacterium invictum]|uniref:AcrR family transcriptional regulator n=1 Tax=Microbacterium invictum TaxID=515415 RepID=A0AA40SL60_9MICO|nr:MULTISPECIES: TetR/AcrR family transcriptional regulator C-terminal domain-containing protein [Microbacterium]MBB4138265.1 AcrR family transcriptional regulator [Microbacterium invictum]
MTDPSDPDLPRGLALAWGVAATPQRGPKREMSVERIVEAAVELADAEGLAAVSMAAVAARLGYTPMSLYRYVTAKDDLILLMQEEATGLPTDQTREGDWRRRLETIYREQVQLYLQHPWVLDVPISGTPVTPNGAAWMDAGLAALTETVLTHDERLAVILLVTGQSRWTGMVMAGYARSMRERGVSDAEVTAEEDALFRLLISPDAYPDLRAAIDAGVFLEEGDPFSFGLARVLDGVDAYLARAADGARDAPRPWVTSDDADIAEDKSYRAAVKAVREAERSLRDARKQARQAARAARDRLR